jgi:phage shock protein A
MAVFSKIMTLVRGSVRELSDAVVDANSVRIYEQEIADARNAINEAKGNLTTVMAKEMQSAREIERLRTEALRLEGLAIEALQKSQQSLAEEVAVRVGEVEAELDAQTKAHATYSIQVQKLRDLIKGAEGRIREHEREAAMAKTTESVYRATQSISNNIGASGSKLLTARESLDRIKRRHEELTDRLAAGEQLDREMGHQALEKKLADAGIGVGSDRATKVMERVRAKAVAGRDDGKS